MKLWKMVSWSIGGIVTLLVLAFVSLAVIFVISSRRGYAKIETLRNVFSPGTSVESLIDHAQQVGVDEIWWISDGKEFRFEDSRRMTLNGTVPLDFNSVRESFQTLNQGEIFLLAIGALPIERFILCLKFESRKVVKSEIRIID